MTDEDEDVPYSYNKLLLLTQPRVIHCLDEYHRQVHWIDRIMKLERLAPKCEPRIRIVEQLASNALNWEVENTRPVPTVSARNMLVHTMAFREISMPELAKELGVPLHLINRVVHDDLTISIALARKLARFFAHPIEFYVDLRPSSSSLHTPDADHAGPAKQHDH